MTCLQPHIYIGPCALEGFCFFVNTTSSRLLFTHQNSFIPTTPVDSGSNDLVLDSLRYVGGTDFYTDHLCFAASLPHHLPSRALAAGFSMDFQPWNGLHGRLSGTLVGIPMHLGQNGTSRKGVRRLPPPLMMRHVARVVGHHLCTPPIHPAGTDVPSAAVGSCCLPESESSPSRG